MEFTVKRRVKRLILLLIAGYALLFVFRLAYGYTLNISSFVNTTSFFDGFSSVQKNYASKKLERSAGEGGLNQTLTVDQKYEKIANLKSQSSEFKKDETAIRDRISEYNGIIQVENNAGNPGNRTLHLMIGINPQKFEDFTASLEGIGKIISKSVTQKDKTNEYRELNAQKASLMSIRASLIELKSKGGKIEEFIELENRILDIEQQLQALGVQLGNYDAENEFCTVQFSLIEGKEQQISFLHRVKVALQWTVSLYLKICLSLLMVVVISYLSILAFDKLKVMSRIVDNLNR